MNTWSGIYKRSFIEKYHIRHNTTPGASFQDNGFWFQTFIYAKRGMIIDKPYYMNRRDNPNSSVNNPEKVYCINVEYDHIKAILLKDPELWNRFGGMYWLKRYHNSMTTVRRIAEIFKKEYIRNLSSELKRAMDKHELDQSVFTTLEWTNIQHIMRDPDNFYTIKFGYTENERHLTREVRRLRKLVLDTRAELKKSKAATEKVRAELKKSKADLAKTKTDLTNTKKALTNTRTELAKAREDLVIVKQTPTFKLGAFILFIPRKIKMLFKGQH